jgi:hypothetical protein
MSDKNPSSLNSDFINDQITISLINERTKRRIILAFTALLILYVVTCTYFFGKSVMTLVLLSFNIVFISLFGKSYRSLSSAVIKGDSLIIRNVENKSSVTHVRSIRTVRTKRLGRKAITTLKYKLDGIQHSALLVSDINEQEPPQFMIQRIQKELKKKKANL